MNRPESLPNGLSQVSVGSIVASRQTRRMGGAHPPNLDFPDFHDERRVFGSNVVVSANQGVGLLTNWTKGLKLHAEIGGFGARNKKPVFMVAPLRDYSTISRNRNIVVGANTRTNGKPR